jgi:splicing factor 3A subunit 1
LTNSLGYDSIIRDVTYRAAWEKHQRTIKENDKSAVEKERLEYNLVDWHDFFVVETVDFNESES